MPDFGSDLLESHGFWKNLKKSIADRYQGRNHQVRRRAYVRFLMHRDILRKMNEELKASVHVTNKGIDTDYLRYRARQCADQWVKEKKYGWEAVEKARNFFVTGMTTLYFAETEDDLFWRDMAEEIASSVSLVRK
jgi:hypothetical protein